MDGLTQSLLPESHALHFKKRREALKLSIGDITQQLKIHEKHLISLEENEMPNHLPFVFVKGYVKLYAKRLAIPETQIDMALDLLEQRHQDHLAQTPSEFPSQKVTPKQIRKLASLFTAILFASLASLSASTFLTNEGTGIRLAASQAFPMQIQKPLDQAKQFIKAHWQV